MTNYRGCAKRKDAKAALAKRAPIVRSKGGSPRPLAAPKAERAEPFAKAESLEPGWNNVHWSRVDKAATPPSPNPTHSPVTETPTRHEVTTTRKKSKTAKSAPKVTVCPKHAPVTTSNKPATQTEEIGGPHSTQPVTQRDIRSSKQPHS
jgi:hypothetical protein